MRLLPDVYQLCGNMYGSHQNVFAVDTEEGLILVDTGLGMKDYDIIRNTMKSFHLEDKPVLFVLLTHEHTEHISNAALFREEGAVIIAHEEAEKNIMKGDLWIGAYRYPGFSFPPFEVDRTVRHEEETELAGIPVRLIHTPGHSRGSVLYEMVIDHTIVVFSGDTILLEPLCHKVRFGWSGGIDYDPEALVRSMQSVSKTDADILLPGHGEVCLYQAHREFWGAWLRARLDLVNDHQRHPVDAEDILCR